MTQQLETDDGAGPPPSDGLTLVGETKSFLKRWQGLMLGSVPWDAEQVAALREKAQDLESRARAADVSGLAHHLQACEQCFWNGEVDKQKLAHCLRNVSEVAWQWRHNLRLRSELYALDGHGHVPHDRLTMEAPTLLTPPSIEMFESSPPPPIEPEPGLTPLVERWQRPSLLERLLSSRRRTAARLEAAAEGAEEGRDCGRRPKHRRSRRKSPVSFPSLADASYAQASASSDGVATSARPAGEAAGAGLEASAAAGAPAAASADAEASAEVRAPAHAGAEAFLASGDGAFAARPRRASVSWWGASLALLCVGGALIWTLGGSAPDAAAPAESGSALPAARAAAPLGLAAVDALLARAHGYGGIESPELADLLDEEAAVLARSGGACAPGSAGCDLMRASHGLAAAPAAPAVEHGVWLDGLDRPGIGVRDDARVRRAFEYHTRSAVGRETFQDLLFRCGPYRELIASALERYGLPSELAALPMAVSGCASDAEAADGARGLWLLTPAAAKAYRLRVSAQVVDERIDPVKATDAAVRLLEDLYRKSGAWELAIAAYRVGPLPLLGALHDADDGASYWALLEAGALPHEAATIVPKVQAFALILANIDKFRFERAPRRVRDRTALLEVPPGTRLGLIARAVGSSTSKIRELNPDVLGDRVPDWPGEKFQLRVPKEARQRARELLPGLIAAADHADECVPLGFDWGRQRFTTAMAARCEQTSGQ